MNTSFPDVEQIGIVVVCALEVRKLIQNRTNSSEFMIQGRSNLSGLQNIFLRLDYVTAL